MKTRQCNVRVYTQCGGLRNQFIAEPAVTEDKEALLLEQHRSQRAGRQLMTLLQFALWHRFFVESVTPTFPEVTDPLTLLSD